MQTITGSHDYSPLPLTPIARAVPNAATILLVDDEPSYLHLVTQFLERNGHSVRCAASGDEAIAVLEHERPDAIVLDVRMPGRSGLDVLRQVRQNPELRPTPVLVVTGARLNTDEEALVLSHGAFMFFKREGLRDLGTYVEVLAHEARARRQR